MYLRKSLGTAEHKANLARFLKGARNSKGKIKGKMEASGSRGLGSLSSFARGSTEPSAVRSAAAPLSQAIAAAEKPGQFRRARPVTRALGQSAGDGRACGLGTLVIPARDD